MGDAAIPRIDTRNLALGVLVALLTAKATSAASPLADAAASGDADRIHAMIAAGGDVNQTANDGATALLWATYYQEAELVGALLDAGADPNIGNDYGITPLLQASSTGDAAIVAALLDAGADPSITHTEGQTALLAAARTGSGETVRLLLDHGVESRSGRRLSATDPTDVGRCRRASECRFCFARCRRESESAGRRFVVIRAQECRLPNRRFHGADVCRRVTAITTSFVDSSKAVRT